MSSIVSDVSRRSSSKAETWTSVSPWCTVRALLLTNPSNPLGVVYPAAGAYTRPMFSST